MPEGKNLNLAQKDSTRGVLQASSTRARKARRAALALLVPLTTLCWVGPTRLSFAADHPGRIPDQKRPASVISRPLQGRTANGQRPADALTLKSLGGNPQPAGKLSPPSWLKTVGRLPLSFEANEGEMDPRARFVSRGNAYTLFLTSTEAVLVLRQGVGHGKDSGKAVPVVVRMHLAGANPAPHLAESDELPGKSNYFLGNDPSQWHTGIPNYGRVTAAEVYPGIDLVYHGNQGQLEYDFEVAPHADPRKIRLALEGIQGLRTDSRGDLLVKVAGGELKFRQPVAYQKTGGVERPVPVRYVLEGKNQVAFRLARYDTRQSLLIDPVLAYSTYLGGSNIDSANGIAVAPDGTAFIAGGTLSTDFPTAHPLQSSGNAFVTKISADGSTLLYSTYLGGANYDVANAIAVDAAGEAFVTGTTNSPDFPVANGFDALCGADGECGASWNTHGFTVSNAFVTKLNVAGSALVYSSYLGYYENVQGHGIAVDGAGNAYVTGETGPNITPNVIIAPPATPPPPFPIVGGFQTTYGGSGTDGFITKIDATASEILYSSYLGGSDEDVAYGIAVDSGANAYLTGITYSSDFPVSATPLQSTNAGAGDAFFTKVNTKVAGAASLVYSTYLGGTGLDQGKGVAVDASDNAYVAGGTTSVAASLGFAVPAGAFQTDCALDTLAVCEGDAMVAKFNPTLGGAASLLYFTYLGGSLADSAAGIAVDTTGDVYVTGSTVSSNSSLIPFPIVGTVFQAEYGGGNADAFVTELNPAGTALVYSTYLGGSNTDTGAGIAVDTHGGTYVTGQTCSTDFPTHLPEQPAAGGNCDAFVSKVVVGADIFISPTTLVFPTQGKGSTSTPQTITVTSNGDSSLTLTGMTLTGTNSADFAETNTCGALPATLAPGSSCTINVTFTPTTGSAESATLSIADNVTGSPQSVSLSGLVTEVFVLPTQLNFGDQLVGTTSAPGTVTLFNVGANTLTITGIGTSGDFAQTNNCGNGLAAGANCTISVTFSPPLGASGIQAGTLTVNDSDPLSPQTVALTGHANAPVASFSTGVLNFGTQGATGPAQTVTLSNVGDGALQLNSISISSRFAQTNNCPTAPAYLVAGASCTFSVTFVPTAPGSITGTLTATFGNAATPPNDPVQLSGTASIPVVSLAPTSLTFTGTSLGTATAAQTIVLANTGNAALSITSASILGVNASEFAISTNTCPASLGAGANCAISITFTPSATGTQLAALSIADNAPGTPQTVGLTGLTPDVSLSTSVLNFGTQGATGSGQTVTLTNSGSAALQIDGISISSPFAQTNTCPTTPAYLAVGASCTFTVTFVPTAQGTSSGSLTITDSVGTQSVTLTGTAVIPVVSPSPASLDFGSQPVNTTSSAQSVVLTNTGNANLNFTGAPTLTGVNASDFAISSTTCPATLAAGANCAVSVTFSPSASGTRLAAVSLIDNAPGSPQSIGLSGTGVLVPSVTLSTSSFTFGSQLLGTTSAAQVVTVTNSGGATLTFSGVTISTGIGTISEFAIAQNTCTTSVAAGGNCTISVTFAPTGLGSQFGTLSISDDAASSPQSVSLSGTGVAPTVSLSPPSLTFANQQVDATSAAESVKLTNTGNGNLIITGLSVSGDFALAAATTTCSTSAPVAPSASCTIAVTFTPTVNGTRSGVVTLTDNNGGSAGSTQTINLTGVGVAPIVSLSPSSLTFTGTSAGVTTPAQAVVLTNTGSAALTGPGGASLASNITITGVNASEFAVSNTCPASLADGANCAISVTFTPSATGTQLAAVSIADNAPGSPQTVGLTGLAPAVTVSPTSLTFTSTSVGATSAALPVTLTNSGSAPLLISSIAASGDFVATNNCGASVAANGGSCTINVTFAPTATGNRYGTLTLTDSASNSPQTVPLAGTGAAAPTVSLAPTSLSFADQPVNTTSNGESVILTNSGGASLTITSITVAGLNSSDFAVSQNTCPATLAAGANCAFAVTFTPTAAGARLASVTLLDSASNSPQSVPLSGNGILLPSVTLSPTSLTFGSEPVGTTSAPLPVTLTNSGGAALNISSVTTIGDFAVSSNPCGASLAAGQFCIISVTFTPTAPGARSGSLIITDNAANSPQAVALAGGATAAPAVTLSPTSLTFPSESAGVTSPAQTVTLSNTGTASLTITSIAITGPFAENTTCGTTLPTSASCTINITFTPTVVGTSTGTLTITDNAPGSPQTVALGGAGSDFSLASSPASVAVYAGTTANYSLALTPKFGFNAKIALTCSGAPSQATCQVTPATITLDGTNPATATLSIATTARVSAWPRGGTKLIPPLARRVAPLPLGIWLLVLVMLTGMLLANRRRRAVLILAFALCCVFLWGACGGGGTLSGVPAGTPAGTSTLTVTATSGAISHNISVTLTVN